ncbi:hypothetical protein AWC38_SpisGene3327 [Stylophora pistillata]|uniref:Fibrinogen C-terminal domain-containing protein n=2 Tax=Stylophora pistillata TaxID=50429 RepID=A0A2B4SU14_STYPI|nr:hypothetical protein AWC38_SpisGene3327 [Stylophora pistillata]
MLASWLTQFVFVTLTVFLVFVVANQNFCASVLETQVDFALLGHVINKTDVFDEFECNLKCIGNRRCKSCNVHPNGNDAGKRLCELNSKTRQMRPSDFKRKIGSTYYSSVQGNCVDVSHERERKMAGQCHPRYKGSWCQTPKKGSSSQHPARSCKMIQDTGDSVGDGEYWIDPENNGNPLKVYCDMSTDGGGWLLVSNLVMASSRRSSVPLLFETSYHAISKYQKNNILLTKTAMNELRTHLNFTQLRFHCSKRLKRTFHVTTAANSFGEAVVQYFSGQIDVLPYSCESFVRMEDDNSELANVCQKWGFEGNKKHNVGKWSSSKRNENRLYDHVVIVYATYHWNIQPSQQRFECDDYKHAVSAGDFWKIYVR